MNQQLKTLSLFPRESKPPSQTSSLTQDPQVWLAVCLTHLALQSQACALSDQPVVVVEAIEGKNVYLKEGPPAGTMVVTVGAAELYGAEKGVGH